MNDLKVEIEISIKPFRTRKKSRCWLFVMKVIRKGGFLTEGY
jgi:hypothetical protein